MSIRVTRYEDWMAPEVAALFHRQYGVARDFTRFYGHPYQREQALRVVALDGDRVVGHLGFCLWPYALDGWRFRSFQACDVLVDPSARGRGTFQRMQELAFAQLDAEFVVGFPVAAAKHAFRRWKNVLDLQWYVKLLNPFAPWRTGTLACPSSDSRAPSFLRLTQDADFLEWRRDYSHPERYVRCGPFELKPMRRGLLRELIVGDVHADDADFAALAKSMRGATYLSIALNPHDPLVSRIVGAGFRKIDRRIAFIVKPFSCEDLVTDPSRWRLFRADIDTW